MNDVAALPPLREVIARYGLSAKRGLGQNFLLDLNLTRRIARAAGPLQGATVIEVGPGPGALTRALLLEGAQHVIGIERDRRCIDALHELSDAAQGRFEVIEADALEIDERVLLKDKALQGPVKVVANLPYNISTALLVKWLQTEPWPPWYESLTLLFQKEVAARLRATPNNKAYGRLSVLTQWRTIPQALFDIDPRAFTPAPKVTSTLMRLEPRPMPLAEAELKLLSEVTGAAFGQRRKMLRSSLASLNVDASLLTEAAHITQTVRAENLSIAEFCALARALSTLRAAKGETG